MSGAGLIAKTGITTQTYAYDDQGRRIRKTTATTQNLLYNGDDIYAEYGSSWTTPAAVYTYAGLDHPISRIQTTGAATYGQAVYYHQDGLGSVVATSNNQNSTTTTQRFDAWGNVLNQTGVVPQFGFTGREPDETGLTYYRARYYNPNVGRFTQRDPIGLRGGINQYAYVNNSPMNFVDPMGLKRTDPSVGNNQSNYPSLAFCIPCMSAMGATMTDAAPVWAGSLPGYQGMQQKKQDPGGYEAIPGIKTDTPPTLAQQIQGKIDGFAGSGNLPIITTSPFPALIQTLGNLILNQNAGPKTPQTVEPVTNSPQAPLIPSGWISQPGRVSGSEIFYPPGTNPATGEHIRVMPPGSSAVPDLNQNGYWIWVNGNRQPMNPSTGRPGTGRGDTHIPLPQNSFPPARRP